MGRDEGFDEESSEAYNRYSDTEVVRHRGHSSRDVIINQGAGEKCGEIMRMSETLAVGFVINRRLECEAVEAS